VSLNLRITVHRRPELADAPPSTLITRPAFRALAKKYRSLASQYSTKIPTYALSYYGPDREWKGLARYRDDTDIAAALKGKETEYAKVTTLMTTPRIEMTYYGDVAGQSGPAHSRPLIDSRSSL
jgi:uncharacterized protein (DUF1684 family)